MTITELTPGDVDRLDEWIAPALRRFGARGYGEYATAVTIDDLRSASSGPDFVAGALAEHEGRRGLLLLTRAAWEESVLERRVGRVFAFIADDYRLAATLAAWAGRMAKENEFAFMAAMPGHSPTFIHIALQEGGFHVASQALTLKADLGAIWPSVSRIPLMGSFRHASRADADAVAEIARHAFSDARFTGDPFLPREWGQQLYASWARNLVNGAADAVILTEGRDGINGFVSVSKDANDGPAVPALMAVRSGLQGWGLGAMLVRKMLEWYRAAGFQDFVGGTEKSNAAMNGLYHQLGFTTLDSNLIYHWVDRDLRRPD